MLSLASDVVLLGFRTAPLASSARAALAARTSARRSRRRRRRTIGRSSHRYPAQVPRGPRSAIGCLGIHCVDTTQEPPLIGRNLDPLAVLKVGDGARSPTACVASDELGFGSGCACDHSSASYEQVMPTRHDRLQSSWAEGSQSPTRRRMRRPRQSRALSDRTSFVRRSMLHRQSLLLEW